MCIFETTPCIYYLSDKNLEDEEYLKLFVFYGTVFDALPDAVSDFTVYLEKQNRISPRAYRSDEITQMKRKIVRPHAKRVNPYGCYDITRLVLFLTSTCPRIYARDVLIPYPIKIHARKVKIWCLLPFCKAALFRTG